MIPKKIKLENIELPNYDFMSEAINNLHRNINSQLDTACIEGLKRKGFEFEHKFEVEEFVKNRCRCEDYMHRKERIYYVDNIPFLMHKYEMEITGPTIENRSTIMTADYGSFAYL